MFFAVSHPARRDGDRPPSMSGRSIRAWATPNVSFIFPHAWLEHNQSKSGGAATARAAPTPVSNHNMQMQNGAPFAPHGRPFPRLIRRSGLDLAPGPHPAQAVRRRGACGGQEGHQGQGACSVLVAACTLTWRQGKRAKETAPSTSGSWPSPQFTHADAGDIQPRTNNDLYT